MKTAIVAALALLVSFGGSAASEQSDKAQSAIALVGGTLIDVSNSRSQHARYPERHCRPPGWEN